MTGVLRRAARGTLRGILALAPAGLLDRALAHLIPHCSDAARFQLGIPTLPGLLRHLAGLGFEPATIVDIGAYVGDWSRAAATVYPNAQLAMIEANAENAESLERTCREIGTRCRHLITLLGPEDRPAVDFYRAGSGSSVLRELTTFRVGPAARLQMRTLDSVVPDAPRPLLMKLDVQGFELEVLRGGARVLGDSEVVVLETSLLPYSEGGPLFAEVVAFMDAAGLVVFDFCGQLRRQTDSVLFQADVVFVRRESALRRARKFWLVEP